METQHPHQQSDPELITAVRAGDLDSFGPLYSRHVEAARRLANGLARDQSEADDLVADAFTKLLGALRAGGGPSLAFRAYLLTTIRNLAYDRRKFDRRVKVTDDLSYHDPGVPFVDTAVADLERMLVARAFARLPERWQTVLWHTQVEGETPAAVAPILGLTPNAVATLAYRARERLRQNYLREHVITAPSEQCQSIVDRLGGYVRHGLSARDRTAVDEHLAGCRRCHALFLELGDVNASLRGVLAPAVLGEAAVTYLGATSPDGMAALITPVWNATKRVARRRSAQAGAAGAAVAGAVVLALVLTAGEPSPPPPAAGPTGPVPGAASPRPPAGDAVPSPDQPTAGTVPGSAPPTGVVVTLEPVGALVRGQPGVLAMAVTAGPAGGTVTGGTVTGGDGGAGAGAGGEGDAGGGASVTGGGSGGELGTDRPAAAQDGELAGGTGPLTAAVTLPAGVRPRAGEPGGGWACGGDGGGIRCAHPPLPAGATTRAYLPVTVSAGAAAGAPRVRVTGPGTGSAEATAPVGVQDAGLPARLAATLPATVVAAGNALLSCPALDPTCRSARSGGEAWGRVDNDRYLMGGFTDPAAPAGAPRHAMVSGATLTLPGEVVWAGLYWAGSGDPPATPTAYLRPAGRARFATVRAASVRRAGTGVLGRPAYQAMADVTWLVRGVAGGRWWVAVDHRAFDPGFGAFGGWALMVAARDGGPDRSLVVFDALTPLPDGASFAAPVYGFAGRAAVGFVAWDGDRGRTGDGLRLAGAALGGSGDRDNVAASLATGTASGANTLGTDARTLAAAFPDGDHRPTLTATAGRDAWLLGPLVMVTPAP